MNPIMIACMKPNGTSQVNAKCPSQHPAGKGNPTAFTVLELLVILAIIAIMAAMLLPVLSRSKLNMQRVSCLNNLRQMAISRHVYTEDNQGNLILSVVGEDSIDTAVQTGDAKVMLCPSSLLKKDDFPNHAETDSKTCAPYRLPSTLITIGMAAFGRVSAYYLSDIAGRALQANGK